MSVLSFTSNIKGASKVRGILAGFGVAITSYWGSDTLQKLLLRRTKARFGKPGSHQNAQKDPTGKPWRELNPATYRRINKDRRQKLVDSGTLLNSIAIVRQRMADSVLQSPTGGGFSIGVKPGAANSYARVHQFGGRAGLNSFIPARRYLGIGDKDVSAVNKSIRDWFRRRNIAVTE